ncbi:MAG: hypothetical protein DRG24_01445 [Epsilonproteobacteria bacterium]|nr:MAG: hypothetical protein DRG24_01445 [Campylobacterota bacterium]
MCFMLIVKKFLTKKKKNRSHKKLTQQSKNPYTILDIPRRSTLREIQIARKRILKNHHPDMLVGSNEELIHDAQEYSKRVNWAYSTLKKKLSKKWRVKKHAA